MKTDTIKIAHNASIKALSLIISLYILTPSISFAAETAGDHCRSTVEMAVLSKSPNEVDMMRAGEKARNACYKRFGNNNPSTNRFRSYEEIQREARQKIAKEKNKLFGEKTLMEATVILIIYFLLGALLVFIPVIGMVAAPLVMGYGVVTFFYTAFRLHYIFIGIILIVLGLIAWSLVKAQRKDDLEVLSKINKDEDQRQKNEQKEKKDILINIALNQKWRNEERQLFNSGDKDALWRGLKDRADNLGSEAFFDLACSHIVGHLILFAESDVAHITSENYVGYTEQFNSGVDIRCLTRADALTTHFPYDEEIITYHLKHYLSRMTSTELSHADLVKIFDRTMFNQDIEKFEYIDKNDFDFALNEDIFKRIKAITLEDRRFRALFAKYKDKKTTLVNKRIKFLNTKIQKTLDEQRVNHNIPFYQLEIVRAQIDGFNEEVTHGTVAQGIDRAKHLSVGMFSKLTDKTRERRLVELDKQADFFDVLSMQKSLLSLAEELRSASS